MANIDPQAASYLGVALNFVAATLAGDAILNRRGRSILFVRNAGDGPINVTIAPVQTTRPAAAGFPQMTVPTVVKAVGVGEIVALGPFPSAYNSATGRYTVTYSDVTSITIAAVEVV